jgi:hypothetical protein
MAILKSDIQPLIDMALEEFSTHPGTAHAHRIAVKIVAAKIVKNAHSLGSYKDGLSETPEQETVFTHDVEEMIISALKEVGAKDDYIEVLRQEFIDSEKKYKLKGN